VKWAQTKYYGWLSCVKNTTKRKQINYTINKKTQGVAHISKFGYSKKIKACFKHKQEKCASPAQLYGKSLQKSALH